MHRFLGAVALLFVAGWNGGAAAQVWTADKTNIANSYGTGFAAPSVAVGVSINGNPVYVRGFGQVSPGGPKASANTVYKIGSLSKQLLAATVLALIEDESGAVGPAGGSPAGSPIALNDPVQKFIPDSGPWNKGTVTLRNLLNMQSGYISYTQSPPDPKNPFPVDQPVKPRELLRYVLSMLYTTPSQGGGLGYAYSNTNYFLLANVIEFYKSKPAGNFDYRDFERSRIFAKAGMSGTGFIEDGFPGSVVAPANINLNGVAYWQPAWPKGAGEVASTVNDMLKWHEALMSDSLVSANARKALMTPPAGSPYAMGWSLNSTPPMKWYNHNGYIAGYNAFDGIFVNTTTGAWVSAVVLTNSDQDPGVQAFTTCLAQLAMDPSKTKAGLNPFAKAVCKVQ